MEVPPRHGKSRTLTNFSAWCLGLDQSNKVITASFNDDLAQDFSRHTRDIISDEKSSGSDLVFSDIFPGVSVKQGDASYKKWALAGVFFSYKGTGIGGSVTGRGGNILIVDDPVKDAEVAYNPAALEKIWLWYTGTFLSRAEEGAIQIICMTPWAKGDLSSRIMDIEPERWNRVTMPAYDGNNMLCDDLLSYERYKRLKKVGDEAIISANYDMVRMDIKGRLYTGFNTYEQLPDDTIADIAYCDTADEGRDFLCSIHGTQKGNYIYVTGVTYTQEPQEVTETLVLNTIKTANTKEITIESNNGGRAFARNIQRLLRDAGTQCHVQWFHQSKNKNARILTNASIVQEYLVFPKNWAILWPQFYNDMVNYQRQGKNAHDDAPDACTGIVEKYCGVYNGVGPRLLSSAGLKGTGL